MTDDPSFAHLLEHNRRYSEAFDRTQLTAAPRRGLAVLTCMDARIDLAGALGLEVGDAHVIRNAGALATEDAIRSLAVSQQLLGTREVVLIAHTRCGLHGADEADLRGRIAASTGRQTDMVFGAFADLEDMVREQLTILRGDPRILRTPIHGLIYEVETGRLRPVA